MVYAILSAGLIILSGFAHLFPRQYISELFLSFLPYRSALFFFGLFLSLVFLRRYMRSISLWKILPWWYKLSGLFSLCFAVLFFLSSSQVSHFYTQNALLQNSGDSLTVLFANIHKNNAQYTWLQDLIIRTDPDLILFVEFANHHYEYLKPFLKARYPYTNSTTWNKQFIGSMVFSKQKIENWADNFPQGMRRYGYFSLYLKDRPYYFYLIHTSSPDSYAHFVMRNAQIATFDKDFAAHAQQRPEWSPIVVVWDFNTTPWSAYYSDIERVFSGTLTNVGSTLPFLRTWKLSLFPLIQAHIDHVWASSGNIQSIMSLPVLGSDHSAYLFEVRY